MDPVFAEQCQKVLKGIDVLAPLHYWPVKEEILRNGKRAAVFDQFYGLADGTIVISHGEGILYVYEDGSIEFTCMNECA
jgi:hypothetical protein